MSDIENQETTAPRCQKSWCLTTEGVLWSSALWLSICSNLTLLFGINGINSVAKHFTATITCTSWLLTFLLYINQNKNLCFSEKYGQEKFSCFSYSMITFVGLFANVFGAVVLYSSSVLNGALVTFSVFELGLLGVVYGLICFYKAKPEIIDAAVNSCTSLTNRCSRTPKSEYESPIEHNFATEFHPIINNPENTNVYVVNEEAQESRSEVAISSRKNSEKSESVQGQEQEQEQDLEKDQKESVKGTPFDSEAEEEEEEQEDKIEETMQASSSFAEITPDSESNEKSPKIETSTAANDK